MDLKSNKVTCQRSFKPILLLKKSLDECTFKPVKVFFFKIEERKTMAHLLDEACIQRRYLLKGTMKILKKTRYCSINKTKDIPIKSIEVP